MKILNRYIIITIIEQMLIILAVFMVIDAVFSFLDQVPAIGKANYDIGAVAIFVLLSLPVKMYELLPLVVLMGTMLGLSKLLESKELLAIRSNGISIYNIVWQLLKAGLVFIFILVSISELYAFKLYEFADNYRQTALNNSSANKELWLYDKDNYIYLKTSNKNVSDVKYINITDNKLNYIAAGDNISYKDNKTYINDAIKTTVNDGNIIQQKTDYKITLDLSDNLLANINVIAEYVDSYNLWQYLQNSIASDKQTFALYRRFMMPILLISMVILGVVFMFGSLRDLSLGRQMFVGIVFSLVFNLVSRLIAEVALAFGYNIFLSAFLPIMLVLLVSLLLLRYRLSVI